jgi:hypothetical protein
VPSVKVPKVDDVFVLGRGTLVHQITPSLLSLQEVAVTNFVLVTTGTELVGVGVVSVMTMRLVTTTVLRTVVEFSGNEDAGTVELAGPVESGMPVDEMITVPEKDDVGGGKLPSKVLLGTGGEYEGGAE